MTQELVDLESERVGTLGALLGVIDALLLFESYDHLLSAHLKNLREARDRYDEISKRYLAVRLEKTGL